MSLRKKFCVLYSVLTQNETGLSARKDSMDSILSLRKKLLRTLARKDTRVPQSAICQTGHAARIRTLEFRSPAHKDTRVLQSAIRQTGHAARKASQFCSPRCFSGVRARCFSGVRHQVCSRKQRGTVLIIYKVLN